VTLDKSELRWGVEQRLEFIEFRLFWEGHVNRGDLTDVFGVSVNQASTDLNRYIGFAPDCAHHGDPATDSMIIRPPIPLRSGHLFHEHPAALV